MNNTQDERRKRWYIAIGIGVLVALLLYLAISWGLFASLFSGAVVAIIIGLIWTGQVADDAPAAQPERTKTAAASGSAASASQSDAEPNEVGTTTAAEFVSLEDSDATASQATGHRVEEAPVVAPAKKPAAKKSAAKKTSGTKTAAKSTGTAKTSSATKAPAKKAAAAKSTKPKSDDSASTKAAKTTTKAKPAAKSAAKPKRAPVAADGKPEMLSKPRSGGADDLKLISGVGPKLEGTLNELGVYHFDQVAGWRKKEVEWVDARLRFKGRIERDDWIKQAKILAKGGETEFSRGKKRT